MNTNSSFKKAKALMDALGIKRYSIGNAYDISVRVHQLDYPLKGLKKLCKYYEYDSVNSKAWIYWFPKD